MKVHLRDRITAWLAIGLVINFLLTAAIFLGISVTAGPTRDNIGRALKATAPAQVLRLQDRGSTDSWSPMLRAYQQKLDDPSSDLYAIFFVDRVKFQYPPSSLLIFDLFPRSMINVDELTRLVGPLKRWLDWLSRIAVGLTVVTTTILLELGVRRLSPNQPTPPARVAITIGLSLAMGLMYYPLLVGYFIGQIQVFLNALLALAVLLSLLGRPALAGMCFGACCLVKPQYGMVLLWSMIRRQSRFTLGLLAILVPGLAISIARFGLADHLRYLDVVRELSRVGETFWFNQSVNGLLNRLLQNGSPLLASPRVPSELPPFHSLVYALTILSSVVLLAIAVWPLRGPRRPGGHSVDMMVMLAAVTMASPIAWNHHYGAFLPIFAATLPAMLYARPVGQATMPLFAVAYIAMANLLVWPPLIFRNPWLGLAGSHVLFGGVVLFSLLLALRAAELRPQESHP